MASTAQTLASLRQLASLGLPGRSVVPELVGLVNRMVGFDLWGLRYIDEGFRLIDGFASPEFSPSSLKDFAENFHGREPGLSLDGAMRGGQKVVLSSRFIDVRKLEGTEFWERQIRPTGLGMPAQLPFLAGDRPFAMLVVGRRLGTKDFSDTAVQHLEAVHPWLCHILACEGADSASVGEAKLSTDGKGTLVLDASGRIQSASPGAVRLLMQSMNMPLTAASLGEALDRGAASLLKRLAHSVGAGMDARQSIVPATTLRSAYGTFNLRAYALDAFGQGVPHQVSLHIERQTPMSLRLFSAPRFLALPRRERDVALRLLLGRSYPETATDLGIGRNSVVYYVRSLFQRLNIDAREQLLQALLSRER